MNFSRTLNFLLSGAIVGIILSSWLGQKAISWWIKPPVDYSLNCDPSVAYSMQRLVLVQAVFAVIFALIFVILKFMIFGKKTTAKNENGSTSTKA